MASRAGSRREERMEIGVSLPTYFGNLIGRRDLIGWAVRAEEIGFDAVAVHDRPAHDTWEPLASLAVVAGVTERIRLATTVVLLPTREVALVAKQAAVIDQASDGRLDLGVGVGASADQFEALGRSFAGRGREYERQLARLNELWSAAIETEESGAASGPAPVQRPRPTLLVGGYAAPAYDRALRFGDGYIFGAAGIAAMTEKTPEIRRRAADAGREGFLVHGFAYMLLSTDDAEIDEAEQLLLRYYGTLRKPFREMVTIGDADRIRAMITSYRAAGLDRLYLFPVTRSVEQLDRLRSVLEVARS
jgi:alkanesulfonate monooxygenase SsuD/methylene tetrahydromethanopterin reductase-like flavin-dependent oxidoreductase (luciferase family)